MNSKFFLKIKKYAVILAFSGIFVFTLISNMPTWILASQASKYSEGRVTLHNLSGTFWHGSGLLVASSGGNKQIQTSAPIAYVNWNISLGFKKYVNIVLSTGKNEVANLYLNNGGLNIDNLNLSLSVIQMTQLVDVVKDLGVSGDFHIQASHILLAKKPEGQLNISIRNVSSGLSPINPLGNYQMTFDAGSGKISVNTDYGSVLNLKGDGSTSSLTLNATIEPSKAEAMKTFITLMGAPRPDGSHDLKLF